MKCSRGCQSHSLQNCPLTRPWVDCLGGGLRRFRGPAADQFLAPRHGTYFWNPVTGGASWDPFGTPARWRFSLSSLKLNVCGLTVPRPEKMEKWGGVRTVGRYPERTAWMWSCSSFWRRQSAGCPSAPRPKKIRHYHWGLRVQIPTLCPSTVSPKFIGSYILDSKCMICSILLGWQNWCLKICTRKATNLIGLDWLVSSPVLQQEQNSNHSCSWCRIWSSQNEHLGWSPTQSILASFNPSGLPQSPYEGNKHDPFPAGTSKRTNGVGKMQSGSQTTVVLSVTWRHLDHENEAV